ncbi:tRNA uridine-5-carboxymethylaminomethyl(34) synthesis GTPase MnmE [Desulfobotulus sp. H1]|uniref:tRNA modification GTPase MnmE n=1 Tax=Desulfobotulus pelophilus TaxID=2823377 RepID=A0ABT3NBK6_9BACT|nr:tRNA uridine-5-carboxymethylaminomethyl(34) synthesis GTPase MnmE [Desulfobotulus pelophilus]MCW7754800.1 tRNA uridine-5-carboxymethylaminomethyl(34) synthesis GTPase MnmE [Desulfobotulus pelophilus]
MIVEHTDTIAAIATPPGAGGIGIVRISGPESIAILCRLFRKKGMCGPAGPADFASRRLTLGLICDPVSGEEMDEVLAVVMSAPASFTGEDVVEIHAHGGPYLIRSLLGLVVAQGARPADPGEFTRRAFLAGRMDLTQAEGVMDLIAARTNAARRMGSALLCGELGSEVRRLRENLLDLATRMAAEIDFPEDVGELVDTTVLFREVVEDYLPSLESLIHRGEAGIRLREGIRLVIAGVPNVGKSSLMNCLLDRERSIVTDIPGTTRDLVEESLNLSGLPVILTDTAGIRDSEDPVESIGVERARASILNADRVLLVLDAGRGADEGSCALEKEVASCPYVVVVNKKDLVEDSRRFSLPPSWQPEARVDICARTGEGVDTLRKVLADLAGVSSPEHAVLPNLRHTRAFEKARDALVRVREGLGAGYFWDLLSVDVDDAVRELGTVLGEVSDPDLLDRIFSDFCIGK